MEDEYDDQERFDRWEALYGTEWDKLGRIIFGRLRQAAFQRGVGGKDPEQRMPVLIGYIEWALEHRANKFTPAQREALELTYGRQVSKSEAAKIAGCSRDAYRKRLAGAERALKIILQAEARIDGKRPSEVHEAEMRVAL